MIVSCSVTHQLLLKFTRSWIAFAPSWSEYVHSLIHHLIIFLCPQLLLINCCWNSLDHGLSMSSVDLNMFVHWFIIWSSFFAPSWFEYCLSSFSGSIALPSSANFSRSIEKCWCYFCQGFCKFDRCSSCLTIFLVLKTNLIFQSPCLFKSNCWNEIRDVFFFFWNQVCLVKNPTHVIQYSPLIVLYFENINGLVVRLKKLFLVLCVYFNIWSWVCYYLILQVHES